MTLLIAWIGVDEKKDGKSVASLYIAADSRYSWGNTGNYDYGVKIFGSVKYPDIFGFCGDVLFPSIVFGQLLPQIDSGLIFDDSDNCNTKHSKIYEYIKTSLEGYPKYQMAESFTILHGTRKDKTFKCFKITYNKHEGLKNEEIDLPNYSTKICSAGSGKTEFDKNFLYWENKKHNNYRTSRAVFHCLNETLKNIEDIGTGGKPQIIGLYRIDNSKIFGIIENGEKYVLGKKCFDHTNLTNIEWRNHNFERIDSETLTLIEGAQRQPK